MAPRKNRRAPQYKFEPKSKPKSNRTLWIAIGIIAVIVISIGAYLAVANSNSAAPAAVLPTKVLLQTTAGNITVDLRTDKPITSGNFINLVNQGKYDNTTFYRTVSGFMIQGGKADGSVPNIKDEIGSNNRNTNYTIAMANGGPNTANSQFFINVEDNGQKYAPNFDSTYAVFGTVISGQDVVNAIANAPATANPDMQGEISIPVNPVTIIHASIVL